MPDRRILRAAALAFVLSRVVFFALVIAGSQISFLGKVYNGAVWETRVDLKAERVMPELERTVMIGDAWFYRAIATTGYDGSNVAFFPVFPLTVRYLAPFGDFTLDALLLSHVALFAALVLLGTLALRSGMSVEDAERAIFYLALFPTSYFLSMPLTESLFLLLSLGAFVCASGERWWLAGILGALAAATRVTGILLLPALLVFALERAPKRRLPLLWLALIPAGLGAFMLHLYRTTGDALAFVHVQSQWKREPGWFFRPLAAFLGEPATLSLPWNLVAMNFAIALLLLIAGLVLLVRKQYAFGTYALLATLLPLSSGSLQSIGRYALAAFPLFFVLAMAGRSRLVDRVITAVAITLYGWLIAMLTLRVDFALA